MQQRNNNSVILVTYPDSLGGSLKGLKKVLDRYLAGAIGGVHLLPVYPSSGDRGYAPLTHLEIDPKFGTWQEVTELAESYDLILDLVCGHISVESFQFKDYLARGLDSPYADLFMRADKVFSQGNLNLEELDRFCFFMPFPPLVSYRFGDGSSRLHFKTFSAQQADLDPDSPQTRELITSFVDHLAGLGTYMLRLDAIDTTCKDKEFGMHMAPRFWAFLDWLVDLLKSRGLEILSEMRGPVELKRRLNMVGTWVYDFHLPPRILHALYRRSSLELRRWYQETPARQFSVLTNHDGFLWDRPGESISEAEDEFLRTHLFENAGRLARRASGLGANNVNAEAINSTLFDVLLKDQQTWLLAYAINLFSPGRPIVYYNDILCQANDAQMFYSTGEGRGVLRSNHTLQKLARCFKQPVVQRLIRLMEFRSTYKAFDGVCDTLDSPDYELIIRWSAPPYQATLSVNFLQSQFHVSYLDPVTMAHVCLSL